MLYEREPGGCIQLGPCSKPEEWSRMQKYMVPFGNLVDIATSEKASVYSDLYFFFFFFPLIFILISLKLEEVIENME